MEEKTIQEKLSFLYMKGVYTVSQLIFLTSSLECNDESKKTKASMRIRNRYKKEYDKAHPVYTFTK